MSQEKKVSQTIESGKWYRMKNGKLVLSPKQDWEELQDIKDLEGK